MRDECFRFNVRSKKNAKVPDFEALEGYMAHSAENTGAIRSTDFDKHISELQKTEAQTMKQLRLTREETEAQEKRKNGGKDKNGKNKNETATASGQ